MLTVLEVTPAGNDNTPDAGVKSLAAVAVSEAVAHATETTPFEACSNVTSNTAVELPALPSTTATSPIRTTGVDDASSLRIVPVPVPLEMKAPIGDVILTVNTSSSSVCPSPLITILMTPPVLLDGIVNFLETAAT